MPDRFRPPRAPAEPSTQDENVELRREVHALRAARLRERAAHRREKGEAERAYRESGNPRDALRVLGIRRTQGQRWNHEELASFYRGLIESQGGVMLTRRDVARFEAVVAVFEEQAAISDDPLFMPTPATHKLDPKTGGSDLDAVPPLRLAEGERTSVSGKRALEILAAYYSAREGRDVTVGAIHEVLRRCTTTHLASGEPLLRPEQLPPRPHR